MARDVNILLPVSARTNKQKIRKTREDPNNTISQINITEFIYRTLYSTILKYTFVFSSVHITFPRQSTFWAIKQVSTHSEGFRSYKIHSTFFDHS